MENKSTINLFWYGTGVLCCNCSISDGYTIALPNTKKAVSHFEKHKDAGDPVEEHVFSDVIKHFEEK